MFSNVYHQFCRVHGINPNLIPSTKTLTEYRDWSAQMMREFRSVENLPDTAKISGIRLAVYHEWLERIPPINGNDHEAFKDGCGDVCGCLDGSVQERT